MVEQVSRHGCNSGLRWPLAMLVLCWIVAGPDRSVADEADKVFKPCANCHEIGPGARHRVGPHLDGLFGRTAGGLPDFRYSEGMRAAGANGLVWDARTLSDYLEKPRDFIKGNRMSFRGMPDAQDRAALVSWLETATEQAPAADPAVSGSDTDGLVRSFADIVLQIDGDPEYGEYLAGECVTCHQASGHADGIPSIVGLPKDYFVKSMFEYRTNVRSNEVMKLRVANLANDEIAALAAYFSSLEPQ
ncbi:MAG: c-type cytochrome [Hoeflea sp.]|nr:c-type cytochrome [Hoeflea sp.]